MHRGTGMIVVTGAGGGIGVATLRLLASEDREVLCLDSSEGALASLERVAADLPGRITLRLSRMETAEECRRVLADGYGRLIGLAHLAGVFEPDPEGIDDIAVFERAIQHNLTNAYLIGNAVHEARDRDRVGAMVFVSSSAFRRGAPQHVPYGVAKAGLVGLTRSFGRRFAPGMRVNALAPALIDTPMPAAIIAERGSSAGAEIPLGRIGRPEEVAHAIDFLLSDRSSFITCQTLNVDGGLNPS